MPDTRHPSRGNLSGIRDARVRDHINKLWQHVDVSLGRLGDSRDAHATELEVAELRRLIAQRESELAAIDRGFRTTTLGGDASAGGGDGGGGAPLDAPYVLVTADAQLTDYRVATAGNNVSFVDGGPAGDFTVNAAVTNAFSNSTVRCAVTQGFGTTVNSFGLPLTVTGGGGVAAPTTTRMGQMPRGGIGAGASAAINTVGYIGSTNPPMWRGNAAGLGGFYCRTVFGIENARNPMKWAVGIRAGTTAPLGTITIDSLTDCVLVGCEAGDTTITQMNNDNAGTCAKNPLGAAFPVTTGEVYIFDVWCDPNASTLNWRLRRFDGTTVSGSLSSEIPSSTTLLAPFLFCTNGATSNVNPCRLSWMFSGYETPYLPASL